MKVHSRLAVLLLEISILMTSVACTATANKVIPLTSFTENYVEVSIFLQRDSVGNVFISGTFTPPEEYHLYSKDISRTGVNGLGRPTLLELTANSQITAIGDLTENVRAQEPDFEPKELLVYPLGPVTLSLPVELQPGNDWLHDEISITYMACSASQCKPPVVGKIVSIRVPDADLINSK